MSRIIEESALLLTSAATDVKCSGGVISITGLKTTTPLSAVTSISQVKYKAEVAQVVTVAGTSYTPAGGTAYTINIYDPLRRQAGYQEMPYKFSYTTPSDITLLGATAALQREAIHGELVSQINNMSGIIHATAVSLGTGTGFTVTDAGGYYPVWSQTMTNILGPNTVVPVQNGDTSGFAATNYSVTTPAVFSVGVGAKLAQEAPVTDAVYGNLISGKLTAPPLTITGASAVSGQNYDAFIITSLSLANAIGITDQYLYQVKSQTVWVDNGTGSATTNLTGFKAFARSFRKLALKTFENDPSAVQQWFDAPIVFQGPLGAAPAGTADVLGWMLSPTGSLNWTNIGTQTIVAPVLNATGLLIDQDDTATEGAHYSANQQTLGAQQFVVGKTEAMVAATVVMGDYTDAAFILGFRKKEAYNAVFNAYTDYATIGNGSSAAGTTYINGDLFVTRAELAGGGITETVSAVAPADGVSYTCWVKVDINGYVTAFVNGTSYPIYSSGTTQMKFAADTVLIPCFQIVNIGGGDPACSISEFWAVSTDSLIS